ncbi:MAG TPA: isocitrate/isopropylmalate dehydrogenase family protein [Anaerolineaceae bacterium]|nr:isocitrate/isopropylmalate dehydrogenase family protein [Anaerolineaceae bacterium]
MPKLCVIPGDGIGREVIPPAVEVLKAVFPDLETIQVPAGWDCFLERGISVPEETLAAVRACGAALFGAVSSPSRKVEGYRSAILVLRQSLDLYASIRPVRSLPCVSPKPGVNLVIVRENTEGLYAGRERREGDTAIAERVITRRASQRIALRALVLLRSEGRRRLTIVHKANILPVTDGLFRDTVRETLEGQRQAGEEWTVDELLVDTAAMKIVSEPERLDALVTTNLFGDILSDAAAPWGGGMGLAPSLNWGDELALAEPVHGSAPDIAGQGIANPIGAVLSAAMLARLSWSLPEAADRIEAAVSAVLETGLVLPGGRLADGVTTEALTKAVLERL